MKQTEHEWKCALTRADYAALTELLARAPMTEVTQTNHYYDTPDGSLRRENITVRIRAKNGALTGTVKRHGRDGCSTEESFGVDLLPERLEVDGLLLGRQGSLTTRRRSCRLVGGMLLMLDENTYLGKTDYELELEYPAGGRERAEGILLFLQSLILHPFPESLTKSERFFRQLENVNKT